MSETPPVPLHPRGDTQRTEHPELARARTAARIVGLDIPLGLVVTEVIVFLLWLPRLPDEVAVHWSVAGVADGFASPILSLVMFPLSGLLIASLFFTTKVFDLQAKLSPSRRRDVWGPINRFLPAIILSSALGIFVLGMTTTWLQLDLADGRDLAPNAAAMIVPWAIAIPVGALAYLAQPKLVVRADVAANRGEPLELAQQERVAWVGAVSASKPYLWMTASALVVVAASLIFSLSIRPLSPTVLAVNIAALGLVLVLTVTGLRFNVRIDERGFEARSFIGWPVVTLDDAESAATALATAAQSAHTQNTGDHHES
ncbi:MAG: DUF1648 domain-containing protein [Leucobacter sp.]|nr:DUF1648 domain-containing protein [Leucobacter sp.]